MTGVGMPLFFWREIATGELTLGDGDTRGRSFQKVAYEDDL